MDMVEVWKKARQNLRIIGQKYIRMGEKLTTSKVSLLFRTAEFGIESR